MTEEIDFSTYLYLSNNKILISDFITSESKCIYKDELSSTDNIDPDLLDKFLEKNILNIEKKNKHFIKKINLIINDNIFLSNNIGIKKIVINETISEKVRLNMLNNLINELKDNFLEFLIVHFFITTYQYDNFRINKFDKNIKCSNFSLEASCILLEKKNIFFYEKILKKYQITIDKIISGNYLMSFERLVGLDECEIGLKISSGLNTNEVFFLPKIHKNKGFFEKFFHFFS